jgi:hypothetical protein
VFAGLSPQPPADALNTTALTIFNTASHNIFDALVPTQIPSIDKFVRDNRIGSYALVKADGNIPYVRISKKSLANAGSLDQAMARVKEILQHSNILEFPPQGFAADWRLPPPANQSQKVKKEWDREQNRDVAVCIFIRNLSGSLGLTKEASGIVSDSLFEELKTVLAIGFMLNYRSIDKKDRDPHQYHRGEGRDLSSFSQLLCGVNFNITGPIQPAHPTAKGSQLPLPIPLPLPYQFSSDSFIAEMKELPCNKDPLDCSLPPDNVSLAGFISTTFHNYGGDAILELSPDSVIGDQELGILPLEDFLVDNYHYDPLINHSPNPVTSTPLYKGPIMVDPRAYNCNETPFCRQPGPLVADILSANPPFNGTPFPMVPVHPGIKIPGLTGKRPHAEASIHHAVNSKGEPKVWNVKEAAAVLNNSINADMDRLLESDVETRRMVEKLSDVVSRMAEQAIEIIDVNIAKHDPQSWDILRQQFLCYRHSLAVAHRMLSAIVDRQKIQSLDPIGTFNLIHLSHALNSMNLIFVDSKMEAILAMTGIAQGQQNHFLRMHAGEVADLEAQLRVKNITIAESEEKIADAYAQVNAQNNDLINIKAQLNQLIQLNIQLMNGQKVGINNNFPFDSLAHCHLTPQPQVAVAALSFIHDDREPAAKKGRRTSEEQATL